MSLKTSVCDEPSCPLVHVELAPAKEIDGTARCKLSVDPGTGDVAVETAQGDAALVARMLEALTDLLEMPRGTMRSTLARRWRVARGKPREGWRTRDWSWWQSGTLVPFREAFPDEPNLLFTSRGSSIWADDAYCISAQCACRNVHLTFLRTDALANGPIAHLDFDIASGRAGGAGTDDSLTPEGQALWKALLRVIPGVRTELEKRRSALARVAPKIRMLAGHGDEHAAVVAPPRLGRNDPCFCGSGRKYKRCCL